MTTFNIDGHKAYAYTGGKALDPALPCVVFVHGALNDHSVWTLLARWFAHHGYGVLAVDLPGHGRSLGAALPDVQAHGTWLLRLLEQAGVRRAALAGHSMGSLIALEAAAQNLGQSTPTCAIDRLAMVGTAYPMKVSEALLQTAQTQAEKAMAMVNSFSHSTLAAKPSYPGPGAWLHGGGMQLMRRMQALYAQRNEGANLFARDFQVCDRYANGHQAAEALRAAGNCKVSFILGERDQMTQIRQSQDLAQRLDAQVFKLGAGHALMGEAPDAMLGALRQALA
ncbi:MAG: alpha/beta hydrolase [Burkholderiaceae bacterium]|nr:alpha/beta hydrolase [Roseateles sp.]MBV8469204.1 alpha/beta hydrolase [Burkholderiaceae bacterium]